MPNNGSDLWKAVGFASYISTYVAVTIAVSGGIGYLLDAIFGLLPLFTILGLVLGLALAFYGVFRMVQRNDIK